jgi:hypothetical protein
LQRKEKDERTRPASIVKLIVKIKRILQERPASTVVEIRIPFSHCYVFAIVILILNSQIIKHTPSWDETQHVAMRD